MTSIRRIFYVSASVLPSRSANSVHVVHQCAALADAGAEVILFGWRADPDEHSLRDRLRETYGQDLAKVTLRTYFSPFHWAANFQLAVFAMLHLRRLAPGEAIITRNPFAALLLAIQGKTFVYEVHDIEVGLRGVLQKFTLSRPKVKIVVISQKLIEHIDARFGTSLGMKTVVLHDAAPAGIRPISAWERRQNLGQLLSQPMEQWDMVCGYFGQLLPGRGIDVIQSMATKRPDCLFLLYGGDPDFARSLEENNASANIRFAGHIPHQHALQLMRSVDALLMPYQPKVSIGVDGHDTGKWMSPMKLFEYMATGVPIISSDLPVLREVLEHERNCLLADPADADSWCAALDKLRADGAFADRIGASAHADYAQHYTWIKRGEKILAWARR